MITQLSTNARTYVRHARFRSQPVNLFSFQLKFRVRRFLWTEECLKNIARGARRFYYESRVYGGVLRREHGRDGNSGRYLLSHAPKTLVVIDNTITAV